MPAPTIGTVKSGRTRSTFRVAWDEYSKEVYVDWANWTFIGRAYSAREAMTKAEAWLYDK
jgi:hypothetical protein